jgi:hypothetical protein
VLGSPQAHRYHARTNTLSAQAVRPAPFDEQRLCALPELPRLVEQPRAGASRIDSAPALRRRSSPVAQATSLASTRCTDLSPSRINSRRVEDRRNPRAVRWPATPQRRYLAPGPRLRSLAMSTTFPARRHRRASNSRASCATTSQRPALVAPRIAAARAVSTASAPTPTEAETSRCSSSSFVVRSSSFRRRSATLRLDPAGDSIPGVSTWA